MGFGFRVVGGKEENTQVGILATNATFLAKLLSLVVHLILASQCSSSINNLPDIHQTTHRFLLGLLYVLCHLLSNNCFQWQSNWN